MSNYRGITLVSCFDKIFTSVLNDRLQNWAQETEINSDAQFWFKAKHSTVDAIFIQTSLVKRHLQNKKVVPCVYRFKTSF